MRIAQVAPLAESVPPQLYGGTERVVSWLTEELVALGNDVTLFASGDSRTRATLVAVCPQALRLCEHNPDPLVPFAVMLDLLADMAPGFDVIHCHLDWLHLPLLRHIDVPCVTTLHGRLDLPPLVNAITRFYSLPFAEIRSSSWAKSAIGTRLPYSARRRAFCSRSTGPNRSGS
jgi:glycosyltransferase involved in cell wall biosynthesis